MLFPSITRITIATTMVSWLFYMTKYERTQHGNLNNIVARILKKKPGPRKAPPRRLPRSSMHSEMLVLTIFMISFDILKAILDEGNALILPLLRLWEPTSSLKPSIKSTWVCVGGHRNHRDMIFLIVTNTDSSVSAWHGLMPKVLAK